MSFLAALRTRLAEPVAACVQAAKAAAEHAMTRLAPAPGDTDLAAPDADPAPLLQHSRAVARPAGPPAADPLDEAQMHLARLSVALASSGDATVAAAGARFHSAARTLIDALSRNPDHLPAHARPLAAWVPGLASATERFVSLQHAKPCPDRHAELVTVLDQVARRILAHARAVEDRDAVTEAA